MGPEVQVPVRVRGLPVDSDIQVAIIFPLEHGVEKGEAPFLLHFHSELDGWPHTVEVAQESFHCALLHDAAGVSSTYLFQSRGLVGADLSASSSKNSMYRFATICMIAFNDEDELNFPTTNLSINSPTKSLFSVDCSDRETEEDDYSLSNKKIAVVKLKSLSYLLQRESSLYTGNN